MSLSPARSKLRTLLIVFVCLVAGGCLFSSKSDGQAEQAKIAEKEKGQRWLRDFIRGFSNTVETAGSRIASETKDIAIKRQSVYYRIQVTTAVRELLWVDNPAIALIDLWTLCVQFESYLTNGDAKQMFGLQQSIAINAAAQVHKQIEIGAAELIPQERFEQARKDVYEFAAMYPIEGEFGRVGHHPSDANASESGDLFAWVPSLASINPFSGVGAGIDSGARAILEVSSVAARFTDVIEFLPIQIAWQLELLQYDIEEATVLANVTKSIDEMNANLGKILATADGLPANVRSEVEKAIDNIDPKLEGIRTTLAGVTEASASLDRAGATLEGTGATFSKTAKSFEDMARQLDTTLKTFAEVYRVLDGDPKATPNQDPAVPETESHPFDIREFDAAAQSIGKMAAQLEVTVAKVQQLVTDERLAGQVEEVGAKTQSTVDSIVWTAVLGGVVLVTSILALLLGYRLLARRLVRPVT